MLAFRFFAVYEVLVFDAVFVSCTHFPPVYCSRTYPVAHEFLFHFTVMLESVEDCFAKPVTFASVVVPATFEYNPVNTVSPYRYALILNE